MQAMQQSRITPLLQTKVIDCVGSRTFPFYSWSTIKMGP